MPSASRAPGGPKRRPASSPARASLTGPARAADASRFAPVAGRIGAFALLAQLVEHLHGKEGVDGSSPSEGLFGTTKPLQKAAFLLPIKTLWTTSSLRRGSIVVDGGHRRRNWLHHAVCARTPLERQVLGTGSGDTIGRLSHRGALREP